jgi:hypothetical protein
MLIAIERCKLIIAKCIYHKLLRLYTLPIDVVSLVIRIMVAAKFFVRLRRNQSACSVLPLPNVSPQKKAHPSFFREKRRYKLSCTLTNVGEWF